MLEIPDSGHLPDFGGAIATIVSTRQSSRDHPQKKYGCKTSGGWTPRAPCLGSGKLGSVVNASAVPVPDAEPLGTSGLLPELCCLGLLLAAADVLLLGAST